MLARGLTRISVLSASLATTVSVGTAFAADYFYMHAPVGCFVRSGTVNGDFGALQNTGSTRADIECPITTNSCDVIDNGSVVTVKDRHSQQNVECTLFDVKLSGSQFLILTEGKASSGNSANWQKLNYTLELTPNQFDQHLFMSCFIPPVGSGNSYLGNYMIALDDLCI